VEATRSWKFKSFVEFTGTVKVISGDPPCQDGNAGFTTVPLNTFSTQ